MLLSTPVNWRRTFLVAALGATSLLSAQAQSGLRYTFPNTSGGQTLALPNGELMLATMPNGTRTVRLHWLNAQGDTVRSRRITLRGQGVTAINSLTENRATGQILVNCWTSSGAGGAALLSAQGDTVWTRPWGLPGRPVGAPDGGFLALGADSNQGIELLPAWQKVSATGQRAGQGLIPHSASVETSYPVALLPASSGYWAMVLDMDSVTRTFTNRVVQISETGVIGTQLTLPGRGDFGQTEAMPNPADGYVVLGSGQLRRFSANWVAQWTSPLTFGQVSFGGLRVAADGSSLLHYGGPYPYVGLPSPLPINVGQITAAGQRVYATTVDQKEGAVGVDLAKSRTSDLLVHTVNSSNNGQTLLVYVLAPTALPARSARQAPGLAVYPQPAADQVTLQTAAPLRGVLALHDAQGRVVREQRVESSTQEINLPLTGLAPGLYVLRATDAAGQVLSARISKH